MDKEWFGVSPDLVNDTRFNVNYKDGIERGETNVIYVEPNVVQGLIENYRDQNRSHSTCYWLGYYHQVQRDKEKQKCASA